MINIIIGPPLVPSINLSINRSVNDITLFILTWSTPFTLPGFPVISYTITITLTNYSDGRESINVNTFDITNTVIQDHQYQHIVTSIGRDNECFLLNFSVMANNTIGSGEHSSVQYSNYIGKI